MTEVKVSTSPFTDSVAGAIRIEAPEFTHIAPEGVHPHMARITVEYVPRETTLDGDSVGEYFIGFRNETMTPEVAVQKICGELAKACDPMMLNVTSNYAPRYGVATSPQARFVHPDAQQKQQGPRIVAPH
jgi:NADPH-dependent 7-cyano-7-deazaguanine reductase QueF